MADCHHPIIKCHKCHRYLDQVAMTQPGNQPIPTVSKTSDGYIIVSGPLEVHVRYNAEGVTINLYDNTSLDNSLLMEAWELYATCEDPWTTLVDPKQQELNI